MKPSGVGTKLVVKAVSVTAFKVLVLVTVEVIMTGVSVTHSVLVA